MKQAFEKYVMINAEIMHNTIRLTLSRLTSPELMEEVTIDDQNINLTFNTSLYMLDRVYKKAVYLIESKKAYTLNFIMKFLSYSSY